MGVVNLTFYLELHKITEYYPNIQTEHYLEKILGREKCNDNTIPLRKLKEFNIIMQEFTGCATSQDQ